MNEKILKGIYIRERGEDSKRQLKELLLLLLIMKVERTFFSDMCGFNVRVLKRCETILQVSFCRDSH